MADKAAKIFVSSARDICSAAKLSVSSAIVSYLVAIIAEMDSKVFISLTRGIIMAANLCADSAIAFVSFARDIYMAAKTNCCLSKICSIDSFLSTTFSLPNLTFAAVYYNQAETK